MLFNSPEFVFAFFPLTLAIYFLVGRRSRNVAFGWLILASLFFYAWWNPYNVLIIGPSVGVNYLVAAGLKRLSVVADHRAARRALLIFGIVFNVAVLGYFKYLNFAVTTLNDLASTDFVIGHVILPLGISFITFQEIAFLIDVHGRQIEHFTFRSFCLFVLFFPQLIAGPIVHYRETMPQFERTDCRFDKNDLALGLTLFCFGLFKKVVLADGIAAHVSPIYATSVADGGVSLFPAWAAALGFTLQIYFDFSGYSDMAIGLARCFRIKLPVNFDSPLKASSIIDFWLRWHVTLTRFLTAYIYNPLALTFTRSRVAKRLPVLGRTRSVGAFFHVLAIPTLLTMLVSGFWHGAGWLFVLWGLVHGVYLTINHAWRIFVARRWHGESRYKRIMRPSGFGLTFLSVVVAMVLFRSTTLAGAEDILTGMLGSHGVVLPRSLLEPLGLTDILSAHIGLSPGGAAEFVVTWAWVVCLLLVAVLLPNSLQITAHHGSALDIDERAGHSPGSSHWPSWQPTLLWAVSISLIAGVAVMQLGAPSEFLYWQF